MFTSSSHIIIYPKRENTADKLVERVWKNVKQLAAVY
jgi:hypothetical protein